MACNCNPIDALMMIDSDAVLIQCSCVGVN